jgi:hypothetical protein
MSETRYQLLITLVHGTWPRGLFPRLFRFKQWVRGLMGRRQPWEPPPFWFEEGSPFLVRLSTELGNIPHKITRLPWTGKNSIYERNDTAHALAERLSVEHAKHSQATQLVIAHSHGGNIALRALYHLQKREASRSDSAATVNPLVATLATPFIEIHQADFGRKPSSIRVAVLLAMYYLLRLLVVWLFPSARSDLPMSTPIDLSLYANLIFIAVVALPMLIIGWYWIERRATARQNQKEALTDATRLGEAVAPQRLLVIRAIDDEASLILAFGTIISYLTTRFIMITYWIMVTLAFTVLPLWVIIRLFAQRLPHFPSWYEDVAALFCSAVIITLFSVLAVARLVHGLELARSPMECQINTQSTPDAKGLSEIVTLVRRTYVKSLRHGIYDHEDCAKTISGWVRSQLSHVRSS